MKWIAIILFLLTAWLPVQPASAGEPKTVIFIVHGTYDGAGTWVNVVPNKVGFASELQRGLGADCEIVPFLWRTSVKHEVRVTAATSLAAQLDEPSYADARLIIVAHSHGGNVALEAVGRCSRTIDTVVCLSTPHVYLQTRNADKEFLRLPVYCSPDARRRIKRLITITPVPDPVPRLCASLRLGLNEQTAIDATRDWRELANNPRLADDGGALIELLEETFDVQLTSNLTISPYLIVADVNIDMASEVIGMRSHDCIHSRRFGFLLGQALRRAADADIEDEIYRIVIASDADDGTPVEPAIHEAWHRTHTSELTHSGWILDHITITGTKKTKPPRNPGQELLYWDADKSWPDLRFEIRQQDNDRRLYFSSPAFDCEQHSWKPQFHIRHGAACSLIVLDNDLPFSSADLMDLVLITHEGRDSRQHRSTQRISMHMVWRAGHF